MQDFWPEVLSPTTCDSYRHQQVVNLEHFYNKNKFKLMVNVYCSSLQWWPHQPIPQAPAAIERFIMLPADWIHLILDKLPQPTRWLSRHRLHVQILQMNAENLSPAKHTNLFIKCSILILLSNLLLICQLEVIASHQTSYFWTHQTLSVSMIHSFATASFRLRNSLPDHSTSASSLRISVSKSIFWKIIPGHKMFFFVILL